MEGKTETPSVIAGEVSASEEKSANDQLGLIGQAAAARRSKIARMVSLGLTVEKDTSNKRRVTPQSIQREFKRALAVDQTDNLQYLEKSGHAITSLNEFLVEQQNKDSRMASQEVDLKNKIWSVEWQMEKAGGLQKILLSRRKINLEKQVAKLQQKSQELMFVSNHLRNQADPLTARRGHIILSEVERDIRLVRDDYLSFSKDRTVEGDVDLSREIQEAYIEAEIVPKLDEKLGKENYQITEAEKQKFIDLLRKAGTTDPNIHSSSLPVDDEWNTLNRSFKFQNFRKYFDLFRHRGDQAIVSQIVGGIAYDEIEKFNSVIPNDAYGTEVWDDPVRDLLRDTPSFRKTDPGTIQIDFLKALKKSTKARAIFGEALERIDKEIYDTNIQKSLTDLSGGYIDNLYYYPTPDAIRNLVLIAAADAKDYRTVHANWCLSRLSQKKDYAAILDEAETLYPELSSVRSELVSWKHNEHWSHPSLKKSAANFSKSMFEFSDNPQLKSLAVEALPNENLLAIFMKNKVITPEVHDKLVLVEKLLVDLTKKSRSSAVGELPYIDEISFRRSLRDSLIGLAGGQMGLSNVNKSQQERLVEIDKLSKTAQLIIENQNNLFAVKWLSSMHAIKKSLDPSLAGENFDAFLNAYKEIPELTSNDGLIEQFCKQYDTSLNIEFFKKMALTYEAENQLFLVLDMVNGKHITQERALELKSVAGDIISSELLTLVHRFPEIYLQTNEDVDYLRKLAKGYGDDNINLSDVSQAIRANNLSKETALAFPEEAPHLMGEKMREIRMAIFNSGNDLIKDSSDARFLDGLVGEFGPKADPIIRGYRECVVTGVISTKEKGLITEFLKRFRVISPAIIGAYKEAKEGGYDQVLIAELNSISGRMTGAGIITPEERKKAYFRDLLSHVYQNNSGQWAIKGSANGCADRNQDLAAFKIQPKYEIDLLSQSEISLKEGTTTDQTVIEQSQMQILNVADKMKIREFDKERVLAELETDIDNRLAVILAEPGAATINTANLTSLDEKLFVVLADSVYGVGATPLEDVKQLIIRYEFANFEDINDYIAGTRDRVGIANNQDYAILCELEGFYSDRIKEVHRRLAENAFENREIASLMSVYFDRLSKDTSFAERKSKIDKLQMDKLGLSDSFLEQMAKILSKKRNRKYNPAELREIITRYESFTGGLRENKTTSLNPQTRAFYGQLRNQREKTFEAIEVVTGQKVDPATFLGEIEIGQIMSVEQEISTGKYNESQFASYTVQRFLDIFEEEKEQLRVELDKFVSSSGKEREILNAYITKTKESSQARSVGGVCVAGDNPIKIATNKVEGNQWDMENFFQMVFQDPDNFRCQGLVLMHHFLEDGKKILAISVNPSSTYLYSVDEEALFTGIMSKIEQFATENEFDLVTMSKNHTIRTNRTGGAFEKAIDARVAKVDSSFSFKEYKRFSFKPEYQIKDMDVVWQRS